MRFLLLVFSLQKVHQNLLDTSVRKDRGRKVRVPWWSTDPTEIFAMISNRKVILYKTLIDCWWPGMMRSHGQDWWGPNIVSSFFRLIQKSKRATVSLTTKESVNFAKLLVRLAQRTDFKIARAMFISHVVFCLQGFPGYWHIHVFVGMGLLSSRVVRVWK